MLAERLTAPLGRGRPAHVAGRAVVAATTWTSKLYQVRSNCACVPQGPEFVVTVPRGQAAGAADEEGSDDVPGIWQVAPGLLDRDEGAIARVNLRLPDQLKARVEQVASSEGMRLTRWLVRAAAALEPAGSARRRERRAPRGCQHLRRLGR